MAVKRRERRFAPGLSEILAEDKSRGNAAVPIASSPGDGQQLAGGVFDDADLGVALKGVVNNNRSAGPPCLATVIGEDGGIAVVIVSPGHLGIFLGAGGMGIG